MTRLTDDRIVELLGRDDLNTLLREAEAHRAAFPQEMLGHYIVGRVQYMMGDDAAAQANLDHAIAMEPSDRPYFWRGLSRQQTGDDQGALQDLQRARQLNPSAPHIGFELGRLLAALGQFDQAGAVLEQTAASNPDYVPALYTLGNVRADLGNQQGAYEAWQRVVQLQPDHADAHFNLGVFHQRHQNYAAALPHFETLARTGDPDALAKLVQVHYQQGRYAEAEPWWGRAVEAHRAAGKSMFCFDQFDAAGAGVQAYRLLDDQREPRYEVTFYLVRDGAIERKVNLEASTYGRERGVPYLLGEDLPDAHVTYDKNWREWPNYDELKHAVLEAFANRLPVAARSSR